MNEETDVLRQFLSEESRDHAHEAEATAIEEAERVDGLYEAAEADGKRYEDLKALVSACNKLITNANYRLGGRLSNRSFHRDVPSNAVSTVRARDLLRVSEALERAGVWFEDDDPRSMGWVSDRGTP